MTNSISCPVCQNLCSSMASACPQCGHPLVTKNVVKNETSPKNKQPFIIILQIFAYLSLAFGGLHVLFLMIAITAALFVNNSNWWEREGVSTILYIVIGMFLYAIFSFLISQARKNNIN